MAQLYLEEIAFFLIFNNDICSFFSDEDANVEQEKGRFRGDMCTVVTTCNVLLVFIREEQNIYYRVIIHV